MTLKLIIGLQNPGSQYQPTRHNAGGWFVQALASAHKAQFNLEKKLHSNLSLLTYENSSCRLALPTTYMNESGLATAAIAHFYRLQPREILVVHDELDLPLGKVKIKTGGGHGGHNGLRSIIEHLQSSDFHRLRIGIGHPGQKELVLHYVLGKPSMDDKELIMGAIDRASSLIPLALKGDIAEFMKQLNTA